MRSADNGQPRASDRTTDARLMAELAGGDMGALGELVRRHGQRVRALAFRVTRRWDLADDLAQEAFLRVLRSARDYEPSAAFSTWLYRIVVNLCLDALRKPRPAPLGDGLAQRGDPAQAAPEVDLLRRERAEAVADEVARLPDRQRLAVLLHRFEGLGHAEVAKAMGCSASAVESLLVRAYQQLRRRLAAWSPREGRPEAPQPQEGPQGARPAGRSSGG